LKLKIDFCHDGENMTDNDEIKIDDKSGISVEEQKEILTQINGIAEKNRRSLSRSESQGEKTVLNAKKSGVIFPLAVNIAALVILCAGASILILFNAGKDAQVRTGSAVYNLTEKALIEEIREETSQRIAAKDAEITLIISRLEEVDNQLSQFQSGDLTAEQIAVRERLIAMQNPYREELSHLQEERAQILEESRAREAGIRALLEERSAPQKITSGEQDPAGSELARLSGEQQILAAIDFQFAGGIASVSSLAKDGEYDQAANTIENLRNLCNNNPVLSSSAYSAKKNFYNQSLDSVETILTHLRATSSEESLELHTKNIHLENAVAEMQKTIDAFSSGASGQTRRLAELDENIKTLESENSSLSQTIAVRDSSIRTLETERNSLTQTIATRDNTINEMNALTSAQAREIANLTNQLNTIRQLLTE
jgi:chromosome segregation ATPase